MGGTSAFQAAFRLEERNGKHQVCSLLPYISDRKEELTFNTEVPLLYDRGYQDWIPKTNVRTNDKIQYGMWLRFSACTEYPASESHP